MSFVLDFAFRTNTGLVRPLNEDAIGADPACNLFVLADGLGGYSAGEVASVMAVSAVLDRLSSALARSRASGVPFAPDDINAKIELLCLRKRNKAGFKTTGSKWYPFVDLVNNDMIGTYAAWVALGAGITAANVKVTQMDGSQQAVDQASALAILTSAVMTADAWRTKAKQAKADYLANPATFDLRNINWPAGYAG